LLDIVASLLYAAVDFEMAVTKPPLGLVARFGLRMQRKP